MEVARLPWEKGDDRPRPRKVPTRAPHPDRSRHGEGELIGEHGQPSLLLQGQRDGCESARQSDDQLLAEPPQEVVPPGIDTEQRQVREIRMLLEKERSYELLVDSDLSRRLRHSDHRSSGEQPHHVRRTPSCRRSGMGVAISQLKATGTWASPVSTGLPVRSVVTLILNQCPAKE
jgi:hypothetical protein